MKKSKSRSVRTKRPAASGAARAFPQVALTFAGAFLGLLLTSHDIKSAGVAAAALGAVFVLCQLLFGVFNSESDFEITDRDARMLVLSSLLGVVLSLSLSLFVLKTPN